MREELVEFERKRLCKVVLKPKGHTIFSTRWVFRNKLVHTGVVVRNKTQLVAKGYSKMEGIDCYGKYALLTR